MRIKIIAVLAFFALVAAGTAFYLYSHHLEKEISATMDKSGADWSVYTKELGSDQEYYEYSNEEAKQQSAASTIKIFILGYLFNQFKTGKLDPEKIVTITDQDRVAGSGVLIETKQEKITLKELAKLMIQYSDNTATNVLIDQLGGFKPINQYIQKIGAKDTILQRKMMDTATLEKGIDNLTTAPDLGHTMIKFYEGELNGKEYDNQCLAILKTTENKTKLPAKLPQDVTVYNKTGELTGVENDVAIIEKEEKAIVIAALTNSGESEKEITAIGQLGTAIYDDYFK